ncbi:MAG: patatin-like phospholipase family protein [Giesbergeria sp.]
MTRKPVVGLALGSGSARGWAHIGVIRALQQAGIQPDLVCGSSIGAVVGAAYALGELDRFEQWALGLTGRTVFSFMDFKLSGGMLKGEKVIDFFRRNFSDRDIEALDMPFAAVATALHSGSEVWLRSGSTADAVRASMALPGLFTPAQRDGRLLVDGGLVNPVPVSLARAMGADIVIAVDLNADILGRHLRSPVRPAPPPEPVEQALEEEAASAETSAPWVRRLQDGFVALLPTAGPERERLPSLLEVVMGSVNIMQVRITRSRMAGEPPEVVIAPRLAHLGLLDFYRAAEAIEEGRKAAEGALPFLQQLGLGEAAE